MEKSDDFRRLRSQKCIILNENKFNGHKGLYSILEKPKVFLNDTQMTEKTKINIPNFDENQKYSRIHHQLLKEMRFQSNFYYLKY